MSTYTIPAGVDVPSEVGATIHLAVPGAPGCSDDHRGCLCGRGRKPPVLAALVQKKCETCGGRGEVPDGGPYPMPERCPACDGSGFDLLDLKRAVQPDEEFAGRQGWSGHISLGRWKVEALDADDQGGYVATLTLVVAP